MTSSSTNRFERGLAQWRTVGAVWCLHAGILIFSFFTSFPVEDLGLQERLVLLVGLIGLLVLEVVLITALFALIELFVPQGKWLVAIDGFKSALLGIVVATLCLSTIKFLSLGVHLNPSDLWFAQRGAFQLFQEVQSAEFLSLLALTGVSIGLVIGVFFAFSRSRKRARPISRTGWLLAVASCGLSFALVGLASQTPRLSIQTFVPELQWIRQQKTASELLDTNSSDGLREPGGRSIEPYEAEPPARPLNVVLLMLESIPWKRSCLNPETRANVTPNLEALAKESVVFDRAYTTSTHSCYAQLAILSSLHPRKYEIHDRYEKLDYPRTLIWDVLQPSGYATGMFSCQNETWANMSRFLDTPGLETMLHSLDWPDAPHKGRGNESKVFEPTVVEAWREWRKDLPSGNYFAYLNFQSNHFPYDLPEDAARPFAPHEVDFAASYFDYPEDKIPVMLNRFDNAQHYGDVYLGKLIDSLKEFGDWDSTVLIVVADHGEAFYEHSHPTHGTTLHEEQVRSLFLVRVPGADPRRVADPVSLLDVGPTLLNVLGLKPHGNFQGRADILDPEYVGSTRPIFFTIQGITSEDGVLVGDQKLIVNLDHESKQLFDLSADPDEQRNLAELRPRRRRKMEQVLGGFLNRQIRYYTRKKWKRGVYAPRLP